MAAVGGSSHRPQPGDAVIATAKGIEVRIKLPRGLGVSPNERVHWAERSRRNGDVRQAACIAALLIRDHPQTPLDHVTVEMEIVWPLGARRRDSDNLTTMLKPVVDGLVDGGVIVSDAPSHATLLPPVQSRDKRASVVLVIARIKQQGEHRVKGIPLLNEDEIEMIPGLLEYINPSGLPGPRDRPYDGQVHTDLGERGRTEIRGITFRDLRDCFMRACFLASGLSEDEWPASIYELPWPKMDPLAVSQNMSCEVERMMGIFPNVPRLHDLDGNPL